MIEITRKNYKTLYNSLKASAKKRNIEFNLTLHEFNRITIPITCPVLNIPIFFNNGRVQDNSISFDRKDSSKGYSFDNIVVVSFRVNKLKSNATFDEIEKIYLFYSNLKKEDEFSSS
jgi:hypothetical protein